MSAWTIAKGLMLKDLMDFGIFLAIIAAIVVIGLVMIGVDDLKKWWRK